ncbi:MAG: homoserine dehydrogenase [Alphaproteobacteria bacterium]
MSSTALSSYTNSNAPVLRVGLVGLGTVGAAVARQLLSPSGRFHHFSRGRLQLVAVSARNKPLHGVREDGLDVSSCRWFDSPEKLATDPDIDIVVELIGGAEGTAKRVVEAALTAGKHVITANKALIARHGVALAAKAEEKGVTLAFEAAVCGGIPVIKGLKEGLSANEIVEIHGVLNGTCNFILSRMRSDKMSLEEALSLAQYKGYAEADPSADIDGADSAHKLALLTAIAFGVAPALDSVLVEGIRHLSLADVLFAEQLGYRIKLLGVARKITHQQADYIEQQVYPCLVPASAQIAAAEGANNAMVAESSLAGRMLWMGQGAGGDVTASAVLADLVDVACGRHIFAFGMPVSQLKEVQTPPMAVQRGAWYLRLTVRDQPGVIADVSAAFGQENVSLRSVWQHSPPNSEAESQSDMVPVVFITAETTESAIHAAMKTIEALPVILEKPCLLRIEKF